MSSRCPASRSPPGPWPRSPSAFAGVVIRRTVPAMTAALGASTGLYVATALYLRAHYQAAVVSNGTIPIPARSWFLAGWYTGPDGKRASSSTISQLILRHFPAGRPPAKGLLLQWLSQRGYTLWTSYQPETRFWHFQLIESGWLLALALLLGAATVWLVRRRAA